MGSDAFETGRYTATLARHGETHAIPGGGNQEHLSILQMADGVRHGPDTSEALGNVLGCSPVPMELLLLLLRVLGILGHAVGVFRILFTG